MTADAGTAAINARFQARAAAAGHVDLEAGRPEDPVARLCLALEANTARHAHHDEQLRRKARAAWPVEIPPMTYTVAGGLLVPGTGLGGSEHLGPRTGYFWDITAAYIDGLVAGAPQQAQGSVTSPGSHVTIAQFGAAAIVPGTYTVQWSVELQGTPAAPADVNNFQIGFAGGSFTNSQNNGAVGEYPQTPFELQIPAGSAALVIRTAAAATAGAIYTATMTLTPTGGGDTVVLYKRFGNPAGARRHTFTAPGTTPGPDWEPGKGTCVMRDGDRLQLAGTSLSAAQVVLSVEAVQVEAAWIGEYLL